MEMMRYTSREHVPIFLAFIYLASNLTLNSLNFYWFGKMIETLRKRFQPAVEPGPKAEKPRVTRSTGADGRAKIEVEDTEVRRRVPVEEEALPALL
jgi:hypothetical protein